MIDDHYEGFENAHRLNEMMADFAQFKDLAKHVGDNVVRAAFQRKPCVRALRYIGYSNWPAPENSIQHAYFVIGEVYHSIDFNGATYTFYGSDNKKYIIGSVFFEIH